MSMPRGQSAPPDAAPVSELLPALVPIAFSDIPGWADDDHRAAWRAFAASLVRLRERAPTTRALGVDGAALARLALSLPAPAGADDAAAVRTLFETAFEPRRIAAPGFVTAYYEPEVEASLVRTARFTVPLYRRPPDLAEIGDAERPAGWDRDIRFARRTAHGLESYPDRAAIEDGALAGRGLELAWLESDVDAFFIHIQGSARLRLPGGDVLRIAFDGKSGHPYTAISRVAVARGVLSREGADRDGLDAWLRADPNAGRALMRENRSFIFFRAVDLDPTDGPMGAAGVPLTAGRSLAVDRTLHTFHAPVWVDVPGLAPNLAPRLAGDDGAPFRRLMIAQDTGSAIIGPARGDLFWGSGAAAGSQAGRVCHAASMVVLVPRGGA